MNYAAQSVVDGAPVVVGPFPTRRTYEIVSDTGQLTYAFADADVSGAGLIALSRLPVTTLIADGIIPIGPGVFVLAKVASAIAATLNAPTAADEGTIMRLTAGTAKAHFVNGQVAGLLQDGVTGGPKDNLTFAAFIGASCTLVALGGFWHVLSLNQVTVGVT